MGLGICNSDLYEAEAIIRKQQSDYCRGMLARPKATGLPPYLAPPRNAIRWQPRGSFTLPAIPDGTDQEVALVTPQVPLGYDGVLIGVTNIWNGTGFVEGSEVITWRIKQDRYYVPFFDTILTTLGSLAIPFDVVGQGIPLLSGQTLHYFVNFAAGSEMILNAGGKTLCALTGYIWPRGDKAK
jgi:hypothetical protein